MTTIAHPPTTDTTHEGDDARQRRRIEKAIRKRSFCTLATVSTKGRPHVAGVVYDSVDSTLYVHTMRTSRKARNVAHESAVAVCLPLRKFPGGPPFTIHFQARAELLDMDDPEIVALLEDGQLGSISGHGALEEPDGCFLRLTPIGAVNSYGVGVSLMGVVRDPLHVGPRRLRWN